MLESTYNFPNFYRFWKIAEKIENFSEALTFHSFSEYLSVVLCGISYCLLKKYSFNSLKKLVVTKILSAFLKILKNRWGRCEIFWNYLRATVRKFSPCFFSEFCIYFFLKNTDSNSVKQLLQSTWHFYRISGDFEM